MSLSERLSRASEPALPLGAVQLAARDRLRARLQDGSFPLEDVPCFCGTAGGLVIAERDRFGLPVTTLLCPRCGLLRTSPRMTAGATARFYAEDYRPLYGQPDPCGGLPAGELVRGEGLLDLVKSLLRPGQNVLEVGCGCGGVLYPFARAGLRAAGCDLDERAVAVGRAHGLDLTLGRARDLLRRGEQADLVLACHVIEHFLDLRTELAEVVALVRPGGHLVVAVPGVRVLGRGGYHGDLRLFLQNAHNFHFSGRTLGYVLATVGLDILSVDESAIAILRRPADWSPAGRFVRPFTDEARELLFFLAGLEQRLACTARAARPAQPPPS